MLHDEGRVDVRALGDAADGGGFEAALEDIGPGRIAAMDAAGIDVSILSVVTPGTQPLPVADAVALARDANDEAASAVGAHPDRFRAFATLPTGDPQAAAAELERCATQLGHVGAMVFGRTGDRPAGRPRLRRPVRDGCPPDPLVDLGLATFGWGWHLEAGLSALRHHQQRDAPRAPAAPHSRLHCRRPVLFSTDYPFHRPDATAIEQFFDAIPDSGERLKIASGNAEALFRLG